MSWLVAAVTQVVLLGTGTPSADPERSGPATAVIVDDTPYLVDFGPGVVRRASAAAGKGMKGLSLAHLKVAFVTHLHADHTMGYADLIITPWIAGRNSPLQVYGPRGLKDMTEHVLAAYRVDLDNRMEERGAKSQLVDAHEHYSLARSRASSRAGRTIACVITLRPNSSPSSRRRRIPNC